MAKLCAVYEQGKRTLIIIKHATSNGVHAITNDSRQIFVDKTRIIPLKAVVIGLAFVMSILVDSD